MAVAGRPATPATARRPETAAPAREIARFTSLMNAHRVSVGCRALTWSAKVAAVAQAHSADMGRRDFFDHINPDGKTPFDRLRRAGIRYSAAAENIAYGTASATRVLELWLKSPGHRANIENCRYTHHGVGLFQGRWTQVFLEKRENSVNSEQ
jgi:uncharacterized protein YkwD